MVITFCYTVGDVESVLGTSTGFPFIQVFYNATGSKAGATVMTSIMIVMSTANGMTNMATASRQLFAFARDKGVPYHAWFARVPQGWDVPLNCKFAFRRRSRYLWLTVFSCLLHHCLRITASSHQHWLVCGIQPDCVARALCPPVILCRQYLLCCRPPHQGRASSRIAIQSGKVGPANQSDRRSICQSGDDTQFLSAPGTVHTTDYELVFCYLCRNLGGGSNLLRILGQTPLRWPGRVRQKECIDQYTYCRVTVLD